MRYLPKGDKEIEHAKSGNGTTHPSRRDGLLKALHSRLVCGVNQEVVISPVTQAKRALRNPRQESEHDAHFQTQKDIKKYG